jgi:NADPH2:quinone reductase
MKAIQVRTVGGPEVLECRDVPDPVPQAGQALVRVQTSGVKFVDVYFREGKYKAPLPFIPGGEGSGHVEALGADVTDMFTSGQLNVPISRVYPLKNAADSHRDFESRKMTGKLLLSIGA